MAQHVKILGWLNIIYGSFGILIGLIVFIVLGGVAGFVGMADSSSDAQNAAPILVAVGTIVVIVLAIVSAPSIIAGIGLLQFRSWARILAIVLSAIHLISIPFGTLLGAYGLWVLLSQPTEALFRQMPPPPPAPAQPYV
jgi:protein-S-isoprenylcysteine O-methyltransferase Ste14